MGRLLISLAILSVFGAASADVNEIFDDRVKRGAPYTALPRWKNPVPYAILGGYTTEQVATIKAGIASIMQKTCIDFFEDSSTAWKLQYVPVDKCSSTVGDVRFGEQHHNISFGPGCAQLGRVQHETSHALGIAHTMMRFDRDNYLTVANFKPQYADNFAKYPQARSPVFVPFEYGSRMMYQPNIYQSSQLPVLVPHDKEYFGTMGSAPELTFYDWKNLNSFYNCSVKCENPGCENGGYPHPRDCTRCLCPDFYDGNLCQTERGLVELKDGENKVLTFSNSGVSSLKGNTLNWKNMNMTLQVIKAPVNRRIRMIVDISANKYAPWEYICPRQTGACEDFAVELVTDGDMAFTGKKFCCPGPDTITLVSKTDVIGYRVYANLGYNFSSIVTFSVEPDTSAPETTTTTTTAAPQTTVTTTTAEDTTTTTTTVAPETTTPEATTTTVPETAPSTTTTTPTEVQTTTTAPVVDNDVCDY